MARVPDVDILNILHSLVFHYCTTALVHTFSYLMMFHLNVETMVMMFKLT